MPELRRKFDADFRAGGVRIVKESGKPIAQVARDREAAGERPGALGEDERAELARLRQENAELAMERDVLKGVIRRLRMENKSLKKRRLMWVAGVKWGLIEA